MITSTLDGIKVSSHSSRADKDQAESLAKFFRAFWPADFHNPLYVDISDGEQHIAYKVEKVS